MQLHAMWIVSEFRILHWYEVSGASLIQGLPVAAAVHRFKDAAAGHADIHMFGVARIDVDRMHFRSIRRAILAAAAPCISHGMLVESRDTVPRLPANLPANQ